MDPSSASFEMKPTSPQRSTYTGMGTPITSPVLDHHPSPRRSGHAPLSHSAADVGVHLAMMPDMSSRAVPRPSSGYASQRTPIPAEASLSQTLPRNYGSSSLMASPQVSLPGQPSHSAGRSSAPGVHASFHQRVASAGPTRQSYPATKDVYTASAVERWNIGGRTLQFS